MKLKNVILSSLLVGCSFLNIQALHLQPINVEDLLSSNGKSGVNLFFGKDIKQRKERLNALKVDYNALLDQLKTSSDEVDAKINSIKDRIDIAKKSLHDSFVQHQDDITRQLNFLNKCHQLLLDIKESQAAAVDITYQHIDFLEEYFEQKDFAKERLDDKSLYTFSDLHAISKKLVDQEERLTKVYNRKQELEEKIARDFAEIKEREQSIKELDANVEVLKASGRHDISQEAQLIDVEKEAFTLEIQLLNLRIDEYKRTVDFCDSKIFVIQEWLKVFRVDINNVRSKLRITQADVASYEQKSLEVKKSADMKKSELNKIRNELSNKKSLAVSELATLAREYKTPISAKTFDQIQITPESFGDLYKLYAIAFAETTVTGFEREIERVKAHIEVENSKEFQAQLIAEAVETLHEITQRELRTNEQLEDERRYYKGVEKTLAAMMKKEKEAIDSAHEFIKQQHKAISSLRLQREKISQLSPRTLVNAGGVANRQQEILSMISSSIKRLEEQAEVALALSELYALCNEVREKTLSTVKFVLQELEAMGVWQRSNRAVTLNGIKQIIPNLIVFVQTLQSVVKEYIVEFSLSEAFATFKSVSITRTLYFSLLMFCLLLLFFFVRLFIPYGYQVLMQASPRKYISYIVSRFGASILGFLYHHLEFIYLWSCAVLIVNLYDFSIGFLLLFYMLISIFLGYISRAFLRYFLAFNRDCQYALLGKRYQDRFVWVFTFFAFSTIFILMLRKAFMLVMIYHQSEFPTILLRLYHIVIFVALILSMDKEEILSAISRNTTFGNVAYGYVNQYYNFLLILVFSLLVLSDPYLGGYGALIWYVAWNVALSLLIIAGLFMLHNIVKGAGNMIFFKEDEEAVSIERFSSAKTWYGVFLITLFSLFCIFGIICIARVWGTIITWSHVKTYFDKGVFSYTMQLENGQMKIEHISVFDILGMILIALSGIFISRLFKRFVLQKVFELQYVEPSLQYALTSISHYVIIIGMILIALIRARLDYLVLYILSFALIAFGWSFRDFFTDFVAYFFILVQRPVKIGDYVKIDDHIMGVVRKISVRAVILRRKNSVTIVVPNSQILKSSLYNWNFVRSFIAFDDITFCVPYSADPEMVRHLLFKMLDQHPEILKMPSPIVRLEDYSDKGYVFMVRGYISSGNTLQMWDIASDVRFGIVRILATVNIRIAEPVMNVYMKKEETPTPPNVNGNIFPFGRKDGGGE